MSFSSTKYVFLGFSKFLYFFNIFLARIWSLFFSDALFTFSTVSISLNILFFLLDSAIFLLNILFFHKLLYFSFIFFDARRPEMFDGFVTVFVFSPSVISITSPTATFPGSLHFFLYLSFIFLAAI